MCGIYGVIPKPGSKYLKSSQIKQFVKPLIQLSLSRGKDASGIALITNKKVKVLKRPISANKLLKTSEFNDLFNEENIRGYIGHARMETNGSFAKNYNNQPVINEGCVTIHNGIIVNVDNLWTKHSQMARKYEVDTEVINALIRKYLKETDNNFVQSISKAFSELEGAFSTASLFEDFNVLLLGTNTGSLYTIQTKELFIFASERYYLEKLKVDKFTDEAVEIQQIKPPAFLIINLESNEITSFLISNPKNVPIPKKRREIELMEVKAVEKKFGTENIEKNNLERGELIKVIEEHYNKIHEVVDNLKRCTKCILPETFPFIEFDDSGICNYCQNYKKHKEKGREALEKEIEKYRNKSGKVDCVIPFSGGRDSSYGVYYLKEVLGLNPLTYTYDWGMVTDLARRNIARMTGQLGVENILISADIAFKRNNVKKNFEAWLKKPELGMIPLLMAGDKHFFYYVNRVKRANNIKMDIWMTNKLENTEFKSGFCGIMPNFMKERIDSMNVSQKLKMGNYYLRNYLKNPAYINSSIFDTIWSFHSYYFEPRTDYYLLYDYIEWDEKVIDDTLINKFEWEISPDTPSTWRIGDGTAPLYNYIYYTVAGFNENDTFRSNQIREGMIDRNKALELVKKENEPRFDSLKWYFDTINIDMKRAVETINNIPKLFEGK